MVSRRGNVGAMKDKIKVNGGYRTPEFVMGQIWESVQNIEKKVDEIDKHGCQFGREVKNKIDKHNTEHKTVYAIMGILAGGVAWIVSQFR